MARIAVVGAGVIGLTCALELARAGHRVSVHADQDPLETVSAVAGGLWFPYQANPRDRVLAWGQTSRQRFEALADHPGTGVRVAQGVMAHRTQSPDLWWADGLPGVRAARAAELPPGALSGTVCQVPLVTMAAYLPWLAQECRHVGAERVSGAVTSLAGVAPDADLVVVAAGLRSGDLTGDSELTPSRGQVVRLANPGLTDWLVDGHDPEAMTYVLPHGDVVVCGGTDVEGSWDTQPDPATEAAIIERARAAVPALANARVVSRAVGLRPVAPEVRLARRTIDGRDVITCYGHGGAGITLSWGCAAEVCRLAG